MKHTTEQNRIGKVELYYTDEPTKVKIVIIF